MSKTKAQLQAEIRELKKTVRRLQKELDCGTVPHENSDVDKISEVMAEMGRRSGESRRKNMDPAVRSELARKAAKARWAARSSFGPGDAPEQGVSESTEAKVKGGGRRRT